MRAVAEMPTEIAARITVLFADIDDTLTNEGRLPAAAYDAVERLTEEGISVAPITGRPAGRLVRYDRAYVAGRGGRR